VILRIPIEVPRTHPLQSQSQSSPVQSSPVQSSHDRHVLPFVMTRYVVARCEKKNNLKYAFFVAVFVLIIVTYFVADLSVVGGIVAQT